MATEEQVQGNTEALAEATTNQATEAQANSSPEVTDNQTDDSTGKEAAAENQPNEAEYNFALPDGFTADEDLTDELKALAKENKFSPEVAQKVADLGVKMQQKQVEAWNQQVDQWAEQVKSDKELGGERFDQNIALARQALDTFGGQELKDLLQSTGFGNHPAIVKAFYNIGKSVSNDTLVVSNGTSKEAGSAASILFPNMN